MELAGGGEVVTRHYILARQVVYRRSMRTYTEAEDTLIDAIASALAQIERESTDASGHLRPVRGRGLTGQPRGGLRAREGNVGWVEGG